MIDADRACFEQLTCLADHAYATDRAADSGTRQLALGTVLSVDPIRLDVASRRLGDGSVVIALHIGERAVVEEPGTTIRTQGTSFKFGNLSLGPLARVPGVEGLRWEAGRTPTLAVGDQIVLADARWFGDLFKSGHEIKVPRPVVDNQAAPKADCGPSSYESDPEQHQWCCRPHRIAEAEWADTLAERRARGELNPQAWPPLVDEERFDVGNPVGVLPAGTPAAVPVGLTLDDLD